jgi:hypothetical protein
LRGVGKTVLLNRIAVIAESEGFKTAYVEAVESRRLALLIIPPLRRLLIELDRTERVNAAVKKSLRVLRSFVNSVKVKVQDVEFGLDIEPQHGEADSGDLESDLTSLFVAVAEAAQSRQTAILFTIDEMQYLGAEDLAALIMAVHRVTQRQLPLIVMGAGLPQFAGLAGNAKSYAERLFEFREVGPLSAEKAAEAIEQPIRREQAAIEAAALAALIAVTRGFPYFLQAWAYNAWNAAANSPIRKSDVESATPATIRQLDEGFFRVRFDRLTPTEKRYLRAMAELGPGPHRSGDIAEKLGREVHKVAPLRSGLIRKGMIYSPAHGDTAFTVPLFDEFLKRMMPVYA